MARWGHLAPLRQNGISKIVDHLTTRGLVGLAIIEVGAPRLREPTMSDLLRLASRLLCRDDPLRREAAIAMRNAQKRINELEASNKILQDKVDNKTFQDKLD